MGFSKEVEFAKILTRNDPTRNAINIQTAYRRACDDNVH